MVSIAFIGSLLVIIMVIIACARQNEQSKQLEQTIMAHQMINIASNMGPLAYIWGNMIIMGVNNHHIGPNMLHINLNMSNIASYRGI